MIRSPAPSVRWSNATVHFRLLPPWFGNPVTPPQDSVHKYILSAGLNRHGRVAASIVTCSLPRPVASVSAASIVCPEQPRRRSATAKAQSEALRLLRRPAALSLASNDCEQSRAVLLMTVSG